MIKPCSFSFRAALFEFGEYPHRLFVGVAAEERFGFETVAYARPVGRVENGASVVGRQMYASDAAGFAALHARYVRRYRNGYAARAASYSTLHWLSVCCQFFAAKLKNFLQQVICAASKVCSGRNVA